MSTVNGKNIRQLQLDSVYFGKSSDNFEIMAHSNAARRMATLVHKIFHLAAKNEPQISHNAISEATKSAALEIWKNEKPNELPKDDDGTYFDGYFFKACYRGWNGKRN